MIVKRVAVVAYHSSPLHEPGSGDAGGMTVYVRGLAHALAQRGIRTDIFTRASEEGDRISYIDEGVRVIPIEAGPRGRVPKEDLPRYIDVFTERVLGYAKMQRLDYDVIHSHYWQSGLAATGLAAAWKVPMVHSHHTLGKVKNAALAPGDRPEPESRLEGERAVIAAADVLIASTEDEYHALSCMYAASHDRVKVLPPGVDHELFAPIDRALARRDLELHPDRDVLLFVGRIQRLKGVDLAVRTLAELVPTVERDVDLVIVGGASGEDGGGEIRRLQLLVGQLGLRDRIRFVGPQPHGRLPLYYAAANAVVVCSHSESFGLAALEAQASGRPVVGCPVGGLSHIVQDGRTGFLIDDRDPALFAAQLKNLLSDRSLAASFEAAASASSERFSWDSTAESFLELYECLVSERAPESCTC
jgi:D-inositol-3-phosphate glycosyltransferase